MAWKELKDYEELAKTLTENFNILADEVQLLSDRKIILEHKLRFAHEQYQYLADKYAPTDDTDIAKTLAQLQLPPDDQITTTDRTGIVPLPSSQRTRSKQQTAIAIRDGRRAVQGLADVGSRVGSTTSAKSISGTSSYMRPSARLTSLSTVLEQDFTVPGKKSSLLCPFAAQTKSPNPTMGHRNSLGASTLESDQPLTPLDARDPTPHHSSDPICAAMYAETMSSAPPSATGSAAKCPIRYLDQHSPEEVAKYFETHKHEIPRSHEVCVKRYQRNENDVRKLDAKYGNNIVSMIHGLGQKHQPMLSTMEEDAIEIEYHSDERVETWAKDVNSDGIKNEEELPAAHEEEREGRFDRPLREIRVGESPSRPWGISVPIQDDPLPQRLLDPPAVPPSAEHNAKRAGKCPFGHGVKAEDQQKPIGVDHPRATTKPPGQCPFGHDAKAKGLQKPVDVDPPSATTNPPGKCPFPQEQTANGARPMSNDGIKPEVPPTQKQPIFVQPPENSKLGPGGPQMVFTGPVFIGYPIEQAMALMQQWTAKQDE